MTAQSTNAFSQATGQVGSHILEHILKNGKHEVTAITRKDSPATFPQGVEVARVDYSEPGTLVEALRGQEVLIITMSVTAPQDTQSRLIEAAAAAGVPWVIPNEWGTDPDEKELGKDSTCIPFSGYCSLEAVADSPHQSLPGARL